MIKIAQGSDGWWFDGDHFYTDRDGTPLDYASDSAEQLRRLIVRRTFNLYRWDGEEGPYGPVSVGFHSLLVAHLAGRLARSRDLSEDISKMAERYGATHDLGEPIGIGDIAGPLLRQSPEVKALNERHQMAAVGLFKQWMPIQSMWNTVFAARVVKDADHLAAAIERRYLFNDNSKDMESPGADALLDEASTEITVLVTGARNDIFFLVALGHAIGVGRIHDEVNERRLCGVIRCVC